MTVTPTRLVAVIDIGASTIQLVVTELSGKGDWKRMDKAMQPVALGRDVFGTGYIGRETSFSAIRILAGFAEIIAGWNIAREDVRVIATSAVREAKNRDTFIEQVFLRTGLRIQILEGIEENQMTYLAVEHAVGDLKKDMARSNGLIIEVGAGSTDVILLRRGKVFSAHALRLGTTRMKKYMDEEAGSSAQMEKFIHDLVRTAQESLETEFRLARVKYFVAVGRSARLAAEKTGTKIKDTYSAIGKAEFIDFVGKVQNCTVEECVRKFQTSYYEAEGLIPSLVIYKCFLEKTSAAKIFVPEASLREGVVLSFAQEAPNMKKRFLSQVMAAVVSLGRKFRFDEKHARHVAKTALSIFDQLGAEHGLDAHARVLLEAAAILHDIGTYLGTLHHERHGQYIIANSEIFGFSADDIKTISLIARFHRKLSPHALPRGLGALPREDRIRILKIAAILRIADALDKSHSQRILSLNLEKSQDEILLKAVYAGDSPLRETLWKSGMFEEVFGYRIRLA